jgi:intracellular sulfur oxidation DsrE/DsrF family protein
MSHPEHTPRRGFLARVAAGAAAFVAAGATPIAAQRRDAAEPHPADRWLDPLTGRHRQIYDVETPQRVGAGLGYARNFLSANAQAYGLADREQSVVVSLRHTAVPFAFGDAAWAAYALGEYVPFAEAGAPARRNQHLGAAVAGTVPPAANATATFAALHARGVVFTVCGLSFGRVVRELAQRSGHPPERVRADLTEALVPGAIVVAAGVVALNRAQERGFSYIGVG